MLYAELLLVISLDNQFSAQQDRKFKYGDFFHLRIDRKRNGTILARMQKESRGDERAGRKMEPIAGGSENLKPG